MFYVTKLISYENFLNYIKEEVKIRLGEEYDTNLNQVRKNNGLLLDGLMIRCTKDKILPSIYLNPYYENYKKGESLDDIVNEVIKAYDEAKEETTRIAIPTRMEFEEMKSRIIYRLVNYEKNQVLLESVPHYRMLEFAVTFHCLIRRDEEGIGSVRITEEHSKSWGVSVEELCNVAMENTKNIFPAIIRPMEDIVYDAIKQETWTPQKEVVTLPASFNSSMYVLTNSCGINGASCLLYQGLLELFYNQLGTDFFLLPSSIHELILVPVGEERDKEHLEEMVKEINQTQVALEEILSDTVYNYEFIRDRLLEFGEF